jgi:nucleoside-diphosphate-sugar epimerase
LRVIITGGEGFIGSSIAEKLDLKGFEIITIDMRLKNEYGFYSSNITNVKANLLEFEKISEQIKKADGIIHLGAVSRVVWGENHPQSCIDINVKGTLNILQSIKKSNRKPWFIFGSSREVYGETNGETIAESKSLKPINVYGISKLAGEQLAKNFANQNKSRALSLRFSNVYGKPSDILDRVIPRFIVNSLLNKDVEIHGGRQVFDFTFIDDTVDGILAAINHLSEFNNKKAHYDSFNILPGEANSLYDLVDVIQQHVKHKINFIRTQERTYDVAKFVGDPSKAKKLLGFKCKYSLKEGINKSMKIFSSEFKNNQEKLLKKFEEDSKFVY